MFLERQLAGNTSVGILNRNTAFYKSFWEHLLNHSDSKGIEALEVILLAFIRAEDELVVRYDKNVFSDFRQLWGSYVERLISHAGS